MWKVYKVKGGKVAKAGFEDEELARDWLESQEKLDISKYDCKEMDAEEEEEFLEALENGDLEVEVDKEFDEEIEAKANFEDYSEDYDEDDSDFDPDEGMLSEFEPEDD